MGQRPAIGSGIGSRCTTPSQERQLVEPGGNCDWPILSAMLGQTPHRRSNFSAPRNSSLEPPGQSRPGYDPVELYSQEGPPEVWLHNHAVTVLDLPGRRSLLPGHGTLHLLNHGNRDSAWRGITKRHFSRPSRTSSAIRVSRPCPCPSWAGSRETRQTADI